MKKGYITREEAKDRLANMNLNDNFLFEHVVGDEQEGETFARLLLAPILHREVGKVRIVPQKTYPGVSVDKHGTRLDLFVEEYFDEPLPSRPEKQIFDIEPDNNDDDKKLLPKRVRFYRAKIDQGQLRSGTKYSKLPNVTIIFISTYDPFSLNRMVYTIRNRCVEVPDLPYEDGAESIFLYTDGTEGEPDEELCQLLHYIRDTRKENAVNETLMRIHSIVDRVRNEEEVTAGYMWHFERDEKLIEKGREEGLEIGREEGLEIGREEGSEQKLIEQVCRKIGKNKTVEDIADELEEDVVRIQRIYDTANRYAPEYDVKSIYEALKETAVV